MVAQSNNFFEFWKRFQLLIQNMVIWDTASDEEIQKHFPEREVIAEMNSIQDYIIAFIVKEIFE